MIRTFKYELDLDKSQAQVLETWRVAAQQLYNGALQERKDAYNRFKISISLYSQFGALADLRQSDEVWKEVPSEVARSALRKCDRSFQNFFRRAKNKEKKPGYPRFKQLKRYNTFGIGCQPVIKNTVNIPKLGYVIFKEYRPLCGEILYVEITKKEDKWFVCFQCDIGEAPTKPEVVNCPTGIDLNLNNFLTLANGLEVEIQKIYRKAQETLKRKQQALSKKHQGSNNWKEACKAVVKVHRKIANKRLDFFRKLVCELFAVYDLIAHEDLSIANMVYGNLAKSIYDAAWGKFIEVLTCKAERAGKWCIPVNPNGTTSRCSNCGNSVHKELKEREHNCEKCGFKTSRDHNAALNVKKLGLEIFSNLRLNLKVPMAGGNTMPVDATGSLIMTKAGTFCGSHIVPKG